MIETRDALASRLSAGVPGWIGPHNSGGAPMSMRRALTRVLLVSRDKIDQELQELETAAARDRLCKKNRTTAPTTAPIQTTSIDVNKSTASSSLQATSQGRIG